jgi:hypothetical protein
VDLLNGLTTDVCDLSAGPVRNAPLVGDKLLVVASVDGVVGGFSKDTVDSMQR